MANNVAQIRSGLETQASTTLGATWQAMRRIYNPEQNDIRTGEKAFGVRVLGGEEIEGVTKVYTVRHFFEIMLMESLVVRNDDAEIQTAIDTLYDVGDDLLSAILSTQLSIPTIVLNIDSPSYSEPEILANETVLIRVGMGVLYRSSLD